MNVKIKGLTEKEQMGIAFFISKGYMGGTIDNIEWSIEFDEKEISQNEIVEMINQGYLKSSEYPEWALSFNRVNVLGQEAMDEYKQETLWRITEEDIHDVLVSHDIPQDDWIMCVHDMIMSGASAQDLVEAFNYKHLQDALAYFNVRGRSSLTYMKDMANELISFIWRK